MWLALAVAMALGGSAAAAAAASTPPTDSTVGIGPLRTTPVPSRSQILPAGRSSGRRCDVDVLVTSAHPGPIHARVVRG